MDHWSCVPDLRTRFKILHPRSLTLEPCSEFFRMNPRYWILHCWSMKIEPFKAKFLDYQYLIHDSLTKYPFSKTYLLQRAILFHYSVPRLFRAGSADVQTVHYSVQSIEPPSLILFPIKASMQIRLDKAKRQNIGSSSLFYFNFWPDQNNVNMKQFLAFRTEMWIPTKCKENYRESRISCWPPTPEGSTAAISCFKQLKGIFYDHSSEQFLMLEYFNHPYIKREHTS